VGGTNERIWQGGNRICDCRGVRLARCFVARSGFAPASVAMSLAVTSMRALSLIAILAFAFVASFSVEAANAAPVGKVTRVQKDAQIGNTPAAVGTPVHMGDQLRTGPDARLQVTFVDDTVLTLGENANVTIDRYVYKPEQSTGEVALTATRAALHFSTGKIKQLSNKNVTVKTPVAALAVRGTVFWAGIVDYHYGVLLVNGKLNVSNGVGGVDLLPGQGTDFVPSLKDSSGPGKPYEWPADKVARALNTTSFNVAFGPQNLAPGLIPAAIVVTEDKPASP